VNKNCVTLLENKMAEDLFAELGYKKICHNISNNKENGGWVTQDEPYILYRSENEDFIQDIEFRFYSKRVWIGAYSKKHNCRISAPLNKKELLAIQMQYDELGWEE